MNIVLLSFMFFQNGHKTPKLEVKKTNNNENESIHLNIYTYMEHVNVLYFFDWNPAK